MYNDITDPIPLYQIALSTPSPPQPPNHNHHHHLSVIREDPYHPHRYSTTISPVPNTNLPREEMKTILLLSSSSSKNGSPPQQQLLLYQFTFDTSQDPTVADRFYTTIQSIIIAEKKNDDHHDGAPV